MTAHPPPVPPDQQSNKGPGDTPKQAGNEARPPRDPNQREQGRQGNVAQNTTNCGYQQDR